MLLQQKGAACVSVLLSLLVGNVALVCAGNIDVHVRRASSPTAIIVHVNVGM